MAAPLIEPGAVLLGLPAEGGRPRVLESLATLAAGRPGFPAADTILEALRAREALGPTALGRGVALPHARMPGLPAPLMLLARLARAVDWEARDGERVDLVLLVLWPEESPDGFLPALAETCRPLREPRVLRRLRAAQAPEDAVAALQGEGGEAG